MRNLHRRHDRTILRLFWAAQWLLPLVSIALFQRRFNYEWPVIFYHLLIVAVAYGSVLGISTALGTWRAVRRRRVARYVLPLVWGFLTIGIYYVNLLTWGGRLNDGVSMRFSWVMPYVLNPSLGIRTFSMVSTLFWGFWSRCRPSSWRFISLPPAPWPRCS